MDKWTEKANRLAVLKEQRDAISCEIHELQKQIWAHEHQPCSSHEEAIVFQMFGKKVDELSKEERRKYNNYLYRRSRAKNTWENSRVRKTFGKPYSQLTKDEIREYQSVYRQEHTKRTRPTHAESLVRTMFGKRYVDLSSAERKQYNKALIERIKTNEETTD